MDFISQKQTIYNVDESGISSAEPTERSNTSGTK